MLTKLAVKYLTWKLRRDRGFLESYKANIAIQFKDSYNNLIGKHDLMLGAVARGWCHEKNENKTMDVDLACAITQEVEKLNLDNVYEASDIAAENFLKLWTKP